MMKGAFLILVFATFAASEICESLYAKKVDAYHYKRISQSVMWTFNNVTKAECMKECQREKFCISFHFSPSGPVCVALRERFERSSVPSVEALGYQLFQTTKPLAMVGSECELDVDCASLTNSHCNEGVCRCDVGYGPDGDTCRILTECSTFSDKFTLYRSFVLLDHDILSQEASTNESCPALCISNNRCKSADFVDKTCYPNTHTWLGAVASSRIKGSPQHDFFQRECLW